MGKGSLDDHIILIVVVVLRSGCNNCLYSTLCMTIYSPTLLHVLLFNKKTRRSVEHGTCALTALG